MFESLINRLKGVAPAPTELPEPDEQLALGALLVRVAKSDAHYHVREIGEIDRILSESFGLNPVEAAKMRATCEKLEAQAPGTPDFALLIRQNVEYPKRLEVLQAMRRVIDADNIHTAAESASVEEIEDLLGIVDADRLDV